MLTMTNLVKNAQGGKMKDVVTQLVHWAISVAVVVIAGQTDFANSMQVGNLSMGNLNIASLVFMGLALGSVGSVIYNFSPRPTPSIGEKAPD